MKKITSIALAVLILPFVINEVRATTFTSADIQKTDTAKIKGTATAVGAGASDAGTQRVILASDSPGWAASTGTVISTGSITAFQGGVWSMTTTASPSASNIVSTFTIITATGAAKESFLPVKLVKADGSAFYDATGSAAAGTTFVSIVSTFSQTNPGYVQFPSAQSVTGAFYQATQPVSIASVSVSGSSVTAFQGGTWSMPVTGTFWPTSQPVTSTSTVISTGSITAFQGGTWSGVGVTGTFWQTTQPVSIVNSTVAVVGINGQPIAVSLPPSTFTAVGLAGTAIGVSNGNTIGKTGIWLSSSVTSSVAGALIVLSSRTTTAGKTFYLQHVDSGGMLVVPSSQTVVSLGSVSFQSPTGTTIDSMTFVNSGGQPYGTWQIDLSEPYPFAAGVTLSVQVRTNTSTATNWLSTIIGYEK